MLILKKIDKKFLNINGVKHFILHKSKHFVLASIVNMDGKYTIFYLDSNNAPLDETDETKVSFLLLIDKIIQQSKRMVPQIQPPAQKKEPEEKPKAPIEPPSAQQFKTTEKEQQKILNKIKVSSLISSLKQKEQIEQVRENILKDTNSWKNILGSEQLLQELLTKLFTNDTEGAIKMLEKHK